jgi:RNA polymerase sigma-B factor
LVEYLARRFSDRGEPLSDLVQVGTIGLIKSIDRFEPERGLEFTTYATPTILGEIKRYFRDSGWLIKVPRRSQELQTSVGASRSVLTQRLGRAPTVREIAADIGISDNEVVDTLEAARAYAATPLDQLINVEAATGTQEALARTAEEFAQVENRSMLGPALGALSTTEREVVILRFYGGRTQSEIASELGVSQMQVSRLVSRSLQKLRGTLTEDH